MKNPNIVLTKDQILEKLWDINDNYIDNNSVTVYIRRLRVKIEDNPNHPKMIQTIRGLGYKWNVSCWGRKMMLIFSDENNKKIYQICLYS